MKVYKYGMRLRPYSISCQPMNGLIDVEDDKSGKFWDILTYRRKLDAEEVRNYELSYLGEVNE